MSAQILACRNEYCQILEHTQNGIASVNDWLIWFLSSLENSLIKSLEMLQKIMGQAKFWHAHHDTILNQRQILMINKLFGNFYGNLTSKKWASITKVSHDTALRDINDLIDKGILKKSEASGRSQSYELVINEAS